MKFIHTADIHFDSPFATLAGKGKFAQERRLEQRKVMKEMVEYIKENNIPYFFIAGDLYEQDYIKKSTVEYVNQLFTEIPNTKIFITPGNHDPYIKNSFYKQFKWSENVHIFTNEIEVVEDENVDIYGYGFNDFYMAKKSNPIHIKNKQKLFKDEEQSLKDSWSVSDRDDRLYELKSELAVYKNAVTEKGKDKYRSLLDEQKKLRREEELYNLQQKNNAVLEKLQAQYDAAEKNKDNILNKITSTNNDLKNIADDFNIDFSQFGKKTEQLLEQLIYEVRSAASKANTNTDNDSRKISINTAVSGTLLDRYINGRSAGLAGVIYNGRVR